MVDLNLPTVGLSLYVFVCGDWTSCACLLVFLMAVFVGGVAHATSSDDAVAKYTVWLSKGGLGQYLKADRSTAHETANGFLRLVRQTNLDLQLSPGTFDDGDVEILSVNVEGASVHHDRVLEQLRDQAAIELDQKLLIKWAHIAALPVQRVAVLVMIATCDYPGPSAYILRVDTSGTLRRFRIAAGACFAHAIRSFAEQYRAVRSAKGKVSGGAVQKIPTSEIANQFASRLADFFKMAGGDVKVINDTPYAKDLVVEGLRGHVLQREKLWERLQVSLLFREDERGGSQLNAIFDGEWATGLGRPTAQQYDDMEPKYARQLYEYSGTVVTPIACDLALEKGAACPSNR